MGYRPLPDCLEIRESPIEGMGLFARKDISKGTILGISHIFVGSEDLVEFFGLPEHIIRTPLGAFYNHSIMPNAKKTKRESSHETETEVWQLETIRNIKSGEEITVHYTFYDPTEE